MINDEANGGAGNGLFDDFGQPDLGSMTIEQGGGTADGGQGQGVGAGTPGGDGGEDPYNFLDDQGEGGVGGAQPVDENGGSQPQGNGDAFNIRSAIESQLAKSLGQVIKLPEDTTEENFAQKLIDIGRQSLSPEALRLQNAIDSGVNPADFYRSFNQYDNALSMNDSELVTRSLKASFGKSEDRPDGWDDAKIADRVSRMDQDSLEERAFEIRKNIRAQKQARLSEMSQESGAQRGPDPSSPEFKKTFDEGFSQVFDDVVRDGDVYGMKFASDKTKEAVSQRMSKVLFPDAKTGESEFIKALRDPKESMKIAMMWDMARTGRLQVGARKNMAALKTSLADHLSKRKSNSSAPSPGTGPASFDIFSEPG